MSFPTHYLDSNKKLWRIVDRLPYALEGEATIAAATAGVAIGVAGAFIHNVKPPFEVHDIIPRAYASAAGVPVADIVPLPSSMNVWWALTIFAVQKGDFRLTRVATRVDTLVDRLTFNWHLSGPDDDAPIYFETAQGLNILGDNLTAAQQMVCCVALRGYVLSLEEAK